MEKQFRFSVFLGWLWLFPAVAFSQNNDAEFRSLVDAAFNFTVTDSNSGQYFKLLKDAEKQQRFCDCDSLKFELYVMIAEELDYRGENPSAYHKKMLDISEKSKSNKLLAKAWSILGHSEMVKGSSKATSYYQNSLRFAKATGDWFFIAVANVENGLLYFSFRQKNRAAQYYSEAIKAAEKIRPSSVTLNEFTTNNVEAYAYNYLAQTTADDQKAYDYEKKAYRLLGKPESELDIQAFKTVSLTLVGLNLKFRDYEDALKNNDVLYQYAQRDQDSYYINAAHINYAMVYARMKHYTNAKKYADLIDRQIDHRDVLAEDPFAMYNFNRTFADIYGEFGEDEKAKFYLTRELKIMDTLLASKQDKLHEDYATKYETEQRKAKIANQNLIIERQASSRNRIVILSVLLILVIVIIYQRYIGKQKRASLTLDLGLKKEKEINQFRKTFFENIAHEIRTPLTLLRGYLDLALENSTSKLSSDYIRKAIGNSSSLLENTNDMLSMMKSEDGDKILSDRIYINEFISGIIGNFQGNMFLSNIIYDSEINDNVFIQTDKSKLEKILNNLIGNAVKYASNSPKIEVFSVLKGNDLMIKVKDYGPGIPSHEKDKVFERFYQSEKNRDNGGFGIGLSMSKDFAVAMGGNITLKTGEGKGCEFIVQLPVKVYQIQLDHNRTTAEEPKSDNIPTLSDGKRYAVLVVEDNPELSQFYKEIFAAHFDCSFASDGVKGLKAAKSKQFDLVISDIMMPEMDGFAFRKNLREIPSYSVTPFILISAKSLTKDKLEGFGLGVDDFISKPFNKDELIVRLKTLLENLENRKQWILENKDETVLPPSVQYQEKVLSKIDAFILDKLADETLSIQDIAAHLGYTSRKLSGEVKQLSGMSLVQYITEIRLREAYLMIINRQLKTVSEISYAVGMESTSYFNKLFKNRYGITPGELLQN